MDFGGLLAALSDSEKAVRIAALRALVRLPLDSETESAVRPKRAEYERHDIFWPTWVPDPETRQRIFEIVQYPEERERARAERIA